MKQTNESIQYRYYFNTKFKSETTRFCITSRNIKIAKYFRYFNYYCFILVFLSTIYHVDAFISFREANARVSNSLKNDRPCNSLLDFNDVHLSTPEIVNKYGYPVERHWVKTEDDYILEIHRIPQKGNNGEVNLRKGLSESEVTGNQNETVADSKPKRVVFLMHGILGSSRDFVMNCDRRALAFLLWENGYDVWMGNYRGNKYSRNHTRLSADGLKFWDFSIDEVGHFDLPAMIDYILNTTAVRKVSIVGHSMGNGMALIMLCTRPEYNDKINIWFAMAAAISLQNTGSQPLRILAVFPRTIEWILTKFNHGELFPPKLIKFLNRFMPLLCQREGQEIDSFHGFCSMIGYILDGYDPGQVSPKLLSVSFAEFPSSTSVKFFVQWMQWIISGDFAMYDYGPFKNLFKYGSVKPKLYSIDKLKVSTVLMFGENDMIVSPSDVLKTERITQGLYKDCDCDPVEYFKIDSPLWNHFDFVLGKDADKLVYSHILKRLELVYQNY